MIDYRKILIAYMEMWGDAEGIDGLGYGPKADLPGLSDEEAIELAKIRDLGRFRHRYYGPDGRPLDPPEIQWREPVGQWWPKIE